MYIQKVLRSNTIRENFSRFAGNIEGARASHKKVIEDLSPGLLSAIVLAASFERRQNNLDGAKAIFEQATKRIKGTNDYNTLVSYYRVKTL